MFDLIAEINRNENEKYLEGLELTQFEDDNEESSNYTHDTWKFHERKLNKIWKAKSIETLSQYL